jgi:UDP-N-acetylmuramate--alanine ligase
MDIKEAKKIYMVGIKGVGMTGLAQILQGTGKSVSGSDTAEEFFTQHVLTKLGIPYTEGFRAENVPPDVDAVIYATSYPPEHPERVEALRRDIAQLSYPEALAEVTKGKKLIAVCGSHGKTTTTAMLGQLLESAGRDPTVLVGSRVNAWEANARVGKSDLFVIEVDEYQDKLQHFQPHGAVLTNIDWDHPDFFPDATSYRDAFARFLRRVPPTGWIIANKEDTEVRRALNGVVAPVTLFDPAAPLPESLTGHIIGTAMAANANAVLTAAATMGIEVADAVLGLRAYRGTARRMEVKGSVHGITVLDDYAHHPTEIRATIGMLRAQYPKQCVTVLFQPHTFSRTAAFLQEFAAALSDADRVWVTDIYGSAREAGGAVDAASLVRAMEGRAGAQYVPFESAAEIIVHFLLLERAKRVSAGGGSAVGGEGPPTVFVTMGAGNGWKVAEKVLHILQQT